MSARPPQVDGGRAPALAFSVDDHPISLMCARSKVHGNRIPPMHPMGQMKTYFNQRYFARTSFEPNEDKPTVSVSHLGTILFLDILIPLNDDGHQYTQSQLVKLITNSIMITPPPGLSDIEVLTTTEEIMKNSGCTIKFYNRSRKKIDKCTLDPMEIVFWNFEKTDDEDEIFIR